MSQRRKSELRSIDVARAICGEPGKPAGQQPEPYEAYFPCCNPQHHDEHPSLKVNDSKNTWGCFPCGAGGNAWELLGFHLGKGHKWESYSAADQKEIAEWLRAHGVLPELPEKRKRARPGRDLAYPVLREFIYRRWESALPIAKRVRYDAPPENKTDRFRWFHPETHLGGAGGQLEWKPTFSGISELPLYVGQPSPKDETTFRHCVERFKGSVEVVFTEGEHDADAAAEIGLTAITSGGTSSLEILRRNLKEFQGKSLSIVQHPGAEERLFCERAAAMLSSRARELKIVTPAELWPQVGVKDLADLTRAMTDAGFTQESALKFFQDRCAHIPAWRATGGAELLDAAYERLRKFVKITEAQARALILWIAAAFIYKQWDHTSYIHIFSGRVGEGKSRLRRVLQAFLGIKTAFVRPSLSALFTDLEKHPGRIQVIDELDKMFNGRAENDAPILAYFTAGFEEGQTVPRTVLGRGTRDVEEFETFCPKILCGRFGERLDDAVRDRCVPIRMRKASWEDHVKAWVKKFHWAETEVIGAKLRAWAESVAEKAGATDICATDAVDFRVIDIWEAQLAVAEVATLEMGNIDPAKPTWLDWARWSMVKQHAGAEGEHDSFDLRLLKAVYAVFAQCAPSKGIFSDQLESEVRTVGEEWMECGRDRKPITKRRISSTLTKTYEIRSGRVTIEGKRDRGYKWVWFQKAFKTWLGIEIQFQTLASIDTPMATLRPEDMSLITQEKIDLLDVRTQIPGGVPVHPREEMDKKGIKWFRLSELRAMRGLRIYRLGDDPDKIYGPSGTGAKRGRSTANGGPGRLITENGHETAMLNIKSFESRVPSTERTERATANMSGLEKRRK